MPTIRHERAAEAAAISALVEAAFRDAAHADGREHLLVDALRTAGDLALSLVAEEDGQLVGHVAFSPVSIDGVAGAWFGLAPLAVLPGRRRRGVGRALVETGLVALRSAGAAGCVVLGDPAYYGRFGFAAGSLQLADVPPAFFMALSLNEAEVPAGEVRYSPVFAPFD